MTINIVFYYDKDVKYSVNALLASLYGLHDVKTHLAGDLDELLEKAGRIKSSRPNEVCIVAISLLTTMLVEKDLYTKIPGLLRQLKAKNCLVVAGGPHPSGDPIGTLYYLGFDFVFIGEAEKTFRDFVVALRDGGDLFSTRGIAYLEGDRLKFTGREKYIDLDQFDPFPYWLGIMSPIEITRGCPYGCFYCQVSYIHGFRYRHRSIDKILVYARESIKLGCRDLRFITPNSLSYGSKTAGKADISALSDLLERLSSIASLEKARIFLGSFPSEVRPDYIDEDVIRIMRKHVSNRSMIIGAQSGSERILRMINRKHGVDEVINAVEIVAKHGFRPEVDIIVGFPGETMDDMYETLRLASIVAEKGGRVHLHHYIPLPGSPFGLKPPSTIPAPIRRHLSKIIGSGRGYGQWLRQEILAWRIIDLREKGVIGGYSKVLSAR